MMVDYSHIVATVIGIFIGLLVRDIYTFIKGKLQYLRETVEIQIKLRFKNVDENEKEFVELRYSILLVKYGKDEVVKEPEKLLNKQIMFKGYNPKVARIRATKFLEPNLNAL